ncbi:MAG: VWA domain-containing protein [Planctomycetota bacterium]|nr:MAG: VWA domain-containing protein [Planctomycetota bacterium]REJ87433.1 MAG: VWA domain-containing protein [Planctomycetota bacterium]
MFGYNLTFESPLWLLLLAVVPVLWWASLRSLAGLGRVRRVVALLLRSIVLLVLIAALADAQLVRTTDRLTVIYLVDQSDSIPVATREQMIEYVKRSWERHRDVQRGDRGAVVVFGRDADVEIGPIADDPPLYGSIETFVSGEFTNLEAAMKMAIALYPEDTAKRVVILTDGNENMGNARRQAARLAAAGVSIDVVPVFTEQQVDVAVEKVTIPADVRRGQPFELRVVLNNNAPPGSGPVTGTLQITRQGSGDAEVIAESRVELPPGKTAITPDVPERIDDPDFYTYEAIFRADQDGIDLQSRNNRAKTFTHVKGRGQVLLIEDADHPGEFGPLVDALKQENILVNVKSTRELFTSLAELQRYDSVVLANVPRVSENATESFTDEQIDMLVRNTQQMGAGLVMIGGPSAFGLGGWANTELEKAMPVDFRIANTKIALVGALCLIMHAGEMANGNYWQERIAKLSIETLGREDYCGLIHYDGGQKNRGNDWLWSRGGRGMLKVGGRRQMMLGRIGRMTPGDMPEFDPGLQLAAKEFAKLTEPAHKHMIIISDGDPTQASGAVLRKLANAKVKITTVGVGTHGPADSRELTRIARATGGKYYNVKNAKALPRIYQREVRRLAKSLEFLEPKGLQPQIVSDHEIVRGIEAPPPITGFVLTQRKESPLVDVAMVSPKPADESNTTLLASWTYGLGRTVALTTDAGARWANSWTGWDDYQKQFSQIVRWSMRPIDESESMLVSTDVEDGKVKVVITAWDEDEQFANSLDLGGSVVDPELKERGLKIEQTAPGRYEGEFDADDAGGYFITINPGDGRGVIRKGVSVPYSSEYRERESNLSLLKELAERVPEGGAPGRYIEDTTGGGMESLLEVDVFRHDLPKARSNQGIWHLLLFVGSCVFFGDVFIRRVHVGFGWLTPLMVRARDFVLRREPTPQASETMARLRSRKAEVTDHIEQRKSTTRFEPAADEPVDLDTLSATETSTPRAEPQSPEKRSLTPEEQSEEEDYTSRLLKAKKDVWKGKTPPGQN